MTTKDLMDQESDLSPEELAKPLVFVGQVLVKLQDAAATLILQVRLRLAQSFTVFSIIFLLLWIAVFLYGSFYFSYMPRAAFSTPVYYYYRTECQSPFLCSYPVANVSLMRDRKHVLTFGQVYRLSLQLEMPDSPTNHELGMFMIKTTCYSQRGQVATSARSARQLLKASSSRFGIMRYRSDLLKTLGTLLFLPFFLTGTTEEKQVLDVELFSEYIDDPYAPSVTAFIEIQSSKVQIYASQLYIHAHFTGLRYLLFQFPVTSAVVGVSSNFVFLSFLFILSYTRQMLRGRKSVKLTQGTKMPDIREVVNNQSHTETDVSTVFAEQVGPEQPESTDPNGEEPSSYSSSNTEILSEDTVVETEESEAA